MWMKVQNHLDHVIFIMSQLMRSSCPWIGTGCLLTTPSWHSASEQGVLAVEWETPHTAPLWKIAIWLEVVLPSNLSWRLEGRRPTLLIYFYRCHWVNICCYLFLGPWLETLGRWLGGRFIIYWFCWEGFMELLDTPACYQWVFVSHILVSRLFGT